MGKALVRDFHTRCLYQKSNERAQRAKIPYARPAHIVISILGLHSHAMKNKNANHSIQKD